MVSILLFLAALDGPPPLINPPHFHQLHVVNNNFELKWAATNVVDFEIRQRGQVTNIYRVHFSDWRRHEFAYRPPFSNGTNHWSVRCLSDATEKPMRTEWSNEIDSIFPTNFYPIPPRRARLAARAGLPMEHPQAVYHWSLNWKYASPPETNSIVKVYRSRDLKTWELWSNLSALSITSFDVPAEPSFYKVSFATSDGVESWSQILNLTIVDP